MCWQSQRDVSPVWTCEAVQYQGRTYVSTSRYHADKCLRMAIFHLHAQIMSRANGQSAVAAAAYRHCAAMKNNNYDREHDFTAKRGNVHSEFTVPINSPAWASALASLPPVSASEIFWNKVEEFEKRSDSQLAREMTLALPVELTREQNIELVRDFVQVNFTSRGIVADWAYHEIKGNPHVHVMTSLRPLTDEGFGPKNVRAYDADGNPKFSKNGHALYRQFAGDKELIPALRESWAETQNHHLAKHGFDIRVDHRSYSDRGILIEPTMHRGPAAEGIERKGGASDRVKVNADIEAQRREQIMADPSIVLSLITAEKSIFDETDVARVIHRYTDNREDFQALFYRVGALENQVMIAGPVFDPFTDRIIEKAKYTTTDILQTERKMISDVRELSSSHGFANDPITAKKALSFVENQAGFQFDEEQQSVIARLTADTGLSVMVGYAGAGKSTVMNAVREIYESHGHKVYGGALAGKAAVGLAESAGIHSRTLASWEASWSHELHQLNAGDVFVLDEAGMVGSSQMQRFVNKVHDAGAKLILLGDARQLQPIQAGAAFRAIAEDVGYIELSGVRRQRVGWMQEATIDFGSGRTSQALGRYIENDLVHFEADTSSARSRLIDNWYQDWEAGSDVLMLAHRNVDVLALNEAARSRIKERGGLQNESDFRTSRGIRKFAVGDRIVFLEKSRDLGVENGTFATVEEVSRGRLSVSLSDGRTVVFSQNDYSKLDHGYAATIHKSQGATVDATHVLASPTMDAHMSYVALSRHRDNATLYASGDDFKSLDQLVEKLSRDRMKDTTLAYEKSDDYQQSVKEFAERRGIPSLDEIGDMFRQQIASMRERFSNIVSRLDSFKTKLGQAFRPSQDISTKREVRPGFSPSHRVEKKAEPVIFPVMSPEVRQALSRLSHNLGHSEVANTDRARKRWFSTIGFELRDGSAANDLSRFNDAIAAILPRSTAVAIGPDIDDGATDKLRALIPGEVLEPFIDNWSLIYAGQKAGQDLMRLDVAKTLNIEAKEQRVIDQYEKRQAMFATPENPLINGKTEWRESVEAVVEVQLDTHPKMKSVTQRLAKAVGSVWREPDVVLSVLKEQVGKQRIPASEIAPVIREKPSSFGELLGNRNILGRNDAVREQALSSLLVAISSLQDYGQVRDNLRSDLTRHEERFRSVMREPLYDLSPAARELVGRIENCPADQMSKLIVSADDKQAFGELRRLVEDTRQRFGIENSSDLDRERLARALPDVSEDRINAFAEGYAKADKLTSKVQAAQEGHEISIRHEQANSHTQERGEGFTH